MKSYWKFHEASFGGNAAFFHGYAFVRSVFCLCMQLRCAALAGVRPCRIPRAPDMHGAIAGKAKAKVPGKAPRKALRLAVMQEKELAQRLARAIPCQDLDGVEAQGLSQSGLRRINAAFAPAWKWSVQRGWRMRYFFNVRLRGEDVPDPEGTEMDCLEDVQAEAMATALDLLREFPGQIDHSSMLEVITEEGVRVYAIALKSSRVVV